MKFINTPRLQAQFRKDRLHEEANASELTLDETVFTRHLYELKDLPTEEALDKAAYRTVHEKVKQGRRAVALPSIPKSKPIEPEIEDEPVIYWDLNTLLLVIIILLLAGILYRL